MSSFHVGILLFCGVAVSVAISAVIPNSFLATTSNASTAEAVAMIMKHKITTCTITTTTTITNNHSNGFPALR